MEYFCQVAELIREGKQAVADKVGISSQKLMESKTKLE